MSLRALVTTAMTFTPGTLPQSVLGHAAATWCDAVSVMAGGVSSEAAAIAARYARTQPGTAPLVAGGSSSPAFAAFANAVAASALDYEDGHAEGGAMHPASPIVPAIVAAAGPLTTMEQAWTAQIAGYEVALRAGRALLAHGDSPWFHSTGAPGAIGAAVAVCHLRGQDAGTAGRAAHIAWLHAPFSTGGWPMVKESIGWGALTGVAAADLAGLGLMELPDGYRPNEININPESPFDLPGAPDDPFVTSMGMVFESARTYFKPFAACRWTHSAADGLQRLRAQYGFDPSAIERIHVHTHEGATHLTEPLPRTIEHGQYSFEMVLSAVALYGDAGWRRMTVEAMHEPERVALAQRVLVHHDPALDPYVPAKLPARVAVELDGGERLEILSIDSLGELDHPLGPDRLHAKWADLLASRLADPDALLARLRDPRAPLLDTLAPLFGTPDPADPLEPVERTTP